MRIDTMVWVAEAVMLALGMVIWIANFEEICSTVVDLKQKYVDRWREWLFPDVERNRTKILDGNIRPP
jgi:hypothetical protein